RIRADRKVGHDAPRLIRPMTSARRPPGKLLAERSRQIDYKVVTFQRITAPYWTLHPRRRETERASVYQANKLLNEARRRLAPISLRPFSPTRSPWRSR